MNEFKKKQWALERLKKKNNVKSEEQEQIKRREEVLLELNGFKREDQFQNKPQ